MDDLAEMEVNKEPDILPEAAPVQAADCVPTEMQTRSKTKALEPIKVDLGGMLQYSRVDSLVASQEGAAMKTYGPNYPDQNTLRIKAFGMAKAEDEEEPHDAYLKWELHCENPPANYIRRWEVMSTKASGWDWR